VNAPEPRNLDPVAGAGSAGPTGAEVIERIARRPAAHDLFQALRRIEAAHPELPRLGDALRPGDEPLRFAQEPSLIFAPAAIAEVEQTPSGHARLVQRVFGFFGPNGALPIHLTEYARERQFYNDDLTFMRFVNMLAHRFGLLFYRAWARAQPTVSLDRPQDAPIVRQVGAFFGMAEPSTRGRDALGDFPKLFFAGRLARSVRDADGLQAWIGLQFGVPVVVEQFCGHWMMLDDDERSRLRRDGQAALGRGAVLGRAVWDVQHKFRIVVGPLAWARFVALLPGGEALDRLQALVRQYVGFEFNWDLRLILRREDVPAWRLGSTLEHGRAVGRLGRTAWMNMARGNARSKDAGELVMNVESIRSNAVLRAANRLH